MTANRVFMALVYLFTLAGAGILGGTEGLGLALCVQGVVSLTMAPMLLMLWKGEV